MSDRSPEPPSSANQRVRSGPTAMEIAVIVGVIVILIALLLPAVRSTRGAAPTTVCKINVTQLGLALRNYHEVYDSFPPAYVVDADGKPLYSWRVFILPFLDRQGLYNGFRLDEPWDSPHNLTLLDVDVPVFRCPSDEEWVEETGTDVIKGMTNYLAVVGPNTVWPMPNACKLDEITDDKSQTVLIVEVKNSGIKWSEPRDLHVTQMAREINPVAGMGLSSHHKGCTHVFMADGTERSLTDGLSKEKLRALLTRAGGEEIGDEF